MEVLKKKPKQLKFGNITEEDIANLIVTDLWTPHKKAKKILEMVLKEYRRIIPAR